MSEIRYFRMYNQDPQFWEPVVAVEKFTLQVQSVAMQINVGAVYGQ